MTDAWGSIQDGAMYHFRTLAALLDLDEEELRRFLISSGVSAMLGDDSILVSGGRFRELWQKRGHGEMQSAEELMSREVNSNADAVDWTAQQFAEAIGRSTTAVKSTEIWKGIMQLRQTRKEARRPDRA